MNVMVNGSATELVEAATVADVVRETTGHAVARGVAVALNGAVVPRGSWPVTGLREGDRVEVLVATRGG